MKKLTLAIIVASSLFLSACGETEISSIQEESINTVAQNNAVVVTQEDAAKTSKEECIRWYAMMWKSNSANAWKSDEELQKNANIFCDAQQGIQNNDPSSCEKSEGILQTSCYSEIAEKTKNPAICEKIAEGMLRSTCYSSVAEVSKDPTICDRITSNNLIKSICIDDANKE